MERGHFEPVRCDCGEVLCDGLFTGVVRVRCARRGKGGCGRRVWIVSDGQRVRTSIVDAAPSAVVA